MECRVFNSKRNSRRGAAVAAAAVTVLLATLAAAPALAKRTPPPPPPPAPPPPCASVSGPANFQCGGGGGTHIFLDKNETPTTAKAEYPKANDADNVAVTLSAASTVADGFANIKPVKDGAPLTDITFAFTDPNNAVTGFLFRGQLNEHADPIVVTVTDQEGVAQVFDYYVTSNSNPADIGELSFSQAIAGERVASVSLYDAGGWYEGKQFEVTLCTLLACPTGGFHRDPNGHGGFGAGGGAGGVPEPASWALMLVGAGLVGACVRTRPRASRAS
jgi:hypothetical protein